MSCYCTLLSDWVTGFQNKYEVIWNMVISDSKGKTAQIITSRITYVHVEAIIIYIQCPFLVPFRLDDEIRDFFTYMTPKPEEHQMREDVVARIRKVITDRWPSARVSTMLQVYINMTFYTIDN